MGKTQFNPSHADPNISGEHQDQDGNSQMAHSLYDQEKNLARRNKIAEARSKQQQVKKKGKKGGQGGLTDGDFDKILGRDIDEFLEDSEWDIESFEQMSHMSKGSTKSAYNEKRLKAME